MKKLGILLVGVVALLLVGCGAQNSPEKAVKAYYKALKEKKFDEAATYCWTNPNDKDAQKNLSESLKKQYEEDNAIVDFKVLGSANSFEDKAEVSVVYEISKPANKDDDKKKCEEVSVVKIDGKWYIKQ